MSYNRSVRARIKLTQQHMVRYSGLQLWPVLTAHEYVCYESLILLSNRPTIEVMELKVIGVTQRHCMPYAGGQQYCDEFAVLVTCEPTKLC